ncbi:MAG: translation elongation factor Ts [Candidatus Absconditabacteria bacterium]|nr:translation elongation factor Ts [Candidatus Absconditabacteria bacterium]MDD3868194.1 translation elongation factor Ts [Candidatus Absconditabacteria bacterium]MDD4714581.1 translation elongation factor Ts [Candidatus Absconditabacteria bacterium]
MKIDMSLIKELRDATFAPLGDCKNALVEAEGDIARATEILREKGIAKAGKKADRETNEGMVKVVAKDGKTVAVKLLCETDFVVKNEKFQELFDKVLAHLFSSSTVDGAQALDTSILDAINTDIAEFVGKIGENVRLAEVVVTEDNVYGYNHPGNKVASLVYYTGDEDTAKELALQVAAMNPTYLTFDEVPADQKEEAKSKFTEELKAAGKPEAMIENIVKGKLDKAFADDVLLEQEYIRDGSKKIKELLKDGFVVTSFSRFAI